MTAAIEEMLEYIEDVCIHDWCECEKCIRLKHLLDRCKKELATITATMEIGKRDNR